MNLKQQLYKSTYSIAVLKRTVSDYMDFPEHHWKGFWIPQLQAFVSITNNIHNHLNSTNSQPHEH